jgi:hypothetical protein
MFNKSKYFYRLPVQRLLEQGLVPVPSTARAARLAPIAANALAGKYVECSWELFRLQHFPGWPHERVAAACCSLTAAAVETHQTSCR